MRLKSVEHLRGRGTFESEGMRLCFDDWKRRWRRKERGGQREV